MSGIIADSNTRKLIVTLAPDLLTPEVIHEKLGKYVDLIVSKSGNI